jgi:hypothetical protein
MDARIICAVREAEVEIGFTLGGAAATPLWLRPPLQLFWIAGLRWSTIARGSSPAPTGRLSSTGPRPTSDFRPL